MLPSTSKVFIAAALCGALTACSSGGSDGPSFNGYVNEGEELATEIEALDPTNPASLPTTGTAQYNGVMALAVDASIDDVDFIDPASILVGDLSLDVGFSDESISGRVTNIVDGNNDRYQGSLSVDEVYFDRAANPVSDYTYGADLSGNVTDPNGANWNVDAEMDGDFFGDNWSHTYGDVSGSACSLALDTCANLDGIYAGQQ